MLLVLFLALVILVIGYQAVQRLRDLLAGVALVQDDLLERSWRTRGRGRHFYGSFAQLGRMRLMPKAHFQTANGQRVRVVYSPVSKIVWSLEPLG